MPAAIGLHVLVIVVVIAPVAAEVVCKVVVIIFDAKMCIRDRISPGLLDEGISRDRRKDAFDYRQFIHVNH